MAHDHANLPCLPPELWAQVCSFLDFPDLASFRLSCRTFGSIGARFAFREIVFYTHPGDFDQLRALANDPAKAKCVQSLIYTPMVYYEETLWQSFGRYSDDVISNAWRLNYYTRAYLDYKKARLEQKTILDNGLDFDLFADVLPKLTALTTFAINCQLWLRPAPGRNPKTPWDALKFIPESEIGNAGRRPLLSLVGGLGGSKTRLKVLRAGVLSWECLRDLPQTRPRLDLFTNLAEVDLRFSFRSDGTYIAHEAEVLEYRRVCETGALSNFLAALPHLEALTVNFSSESMRPLARMWLTDIITTGHRWPHLTSLSLGGINATKKSLASMLMLHKDTLRQLELFTVWLDTSWICLLPQMKELLRLDHAEVSRTTIDDREGWDLDDGDDNPYLLLSAVFSCGGAPARSGA